MPRTQANEVSQHPYSRGPFGPIHPVSTSDAMQNVYCTTGTTAACHIVPMLLGGGLWMTPSSTQTCLGCSYVSLGTTTSPSSLNWSDSEPFPTQRQQTLDDVSSIGLPFISETVPPAGVQAEYVEAPEPRHLSIATPKALLSNPI